MILLQVSGREVFEFNPTLVMEDDEDNEGEVFVHHYDKVSSTAYWGTIWSQDTLALPLDPNAV